MKLILLVAFALVGCRVQTQPVLPSDPIEPETVPSQEHCEAACERLQELGCPEGEPDEDGTPCVIVCNETQEAGLVDLEPEKIAESDECP